MGSFSSSEKEISHITLNGNFVADADHANGAPCANIKKPPRRVVGVSSSWLSPSYGFECIKTRDIFLPGEINNFGVLLATILSLIAIMQIVRPVLGIKKPLVSGCIPILAALANVIKIV
jgi:hypothetical protein